MFWAFILIIPLVFCLIGYLFFNKKLVIWEYVIILTIPVLLTIGSYFIHKHNVLSSTEYNGYQITKARYYESWETWRQKTCSRRVASGKDSKGNTTYRTEYYDCSYCDYTSEKYYMYDSHGAEYSISSSEYQDLIKLWKATPKFNELNRNINKHWGCGKDGDMYSIDWNQDIYTSVSITKPHDYQNILKTNKSAFNYRTISDEEADSLKLYKYPEIVNRYQECVLGSNNDSLKQVISFINGKYGYDKKMRVYILFFHNRPINDAVNQQSYWQNGNKNELVICIGTRNNKIDWVYPFSWVLKKELLVNIREDIINSSADSETFKNIILSNMDKYWSYRNFKEDFSYLSYEPSKTHMIVLSILTLIFSLLILIFGIFNDINNE